MTGGQAPGCGAGPTVRHPVFARLYARMSAAAERKGAAEHRRELLDGIGGRVIEVGAGTLTKPASPHILAVARPRP